MAYPFVVSGSLWFPFRRRKKQRRKVVLEREREDSEGIKGGKRKRGRANERRRRKKEKEVPPVPRGVRSTPFLFPFHSGKTNSRDFNDTRMIYVASRENEGAIFFFFFEIPGGEKEFQEGKITLAD